MGGVDQGAPKVELLHGRINKTTNWANEDGVSRPNERYSWAQNI